MAGRQTGRQTGRQAGRQTGRQDGWQADRQAGWQARWMAGRQAGRQAGWLAGWVQCNSWSSFGGVHSEHSCPYERMVVIKVALTKCMYVCMFVCMCDYAIVSVYLVVFALCIGTCVIASCSLFPLFIVNLLLFLCIFIGLLFRCIFVVCKVGGGSWASSESYGRVRQSHPSRAGRPAA